MTTIELRPPRPSATCTACWPRPGEGASYVLVGQGTGGVRGSRQFSVLPDYASQYPMMTRPYGLMPTITRLGDGRLVPALSANDVPGYAGKQAGIFGISPRDARAARRGLHLPPVVRTGRMP